MKKALKKLIPTIIMVLIAASMVGTSTFAWFSMNSKVTVTGMTVTTKLSNNLLISETNANDGTYTRALHQSRTALLEPASTVNGVNYFWTSTTNVWGNGDAKTDAYVEYSEATDVTDIPGGATVNAAGKTKKDTAFNTNYMISTGTAYAYVDYVFYLKGTNADSSNEAIYAKKCNLLYKGAAVGEKAWRVAFFVQDAAQDTPLATAPTASNLKTILKMSDSHYFSYDGADADTDDQAVSSETTPWFDDVEDIGERAILKTVNAGTTERIKVTVRLWLEGEDTTCNNETFASLTSDWQLDLEFVLDGNSSTNAVNLIGTVANAVATASGNVGTVTLTTGKLANGETPTTFTWKNAADGTAATGTPSGDPSGSVFTSTESTPGTYKVYCEITTDVGNVYRTNVVDLTVS